MQTRTYTVAVVECGRHRHLKDRVVTLRISHWHHGPWASLSPVGRLADGVDFPLSGEEREGDVLTLQGPNTRWTLRILREGE